MEGTGLNVLVAGERVRVGAAVQEEARGLDVPEETGEPERLETVVAERVRLRRVFVEQLAEAVGSTESRRLEHVQLGIGGEQRGNPIVVSAVQGLEQLRHTS